VWDQHTLGRIDKCDSKAEEWRQYQMCLEYYLQANTVTDAENKAVLITYVDFGSLVMVRDRTVCGIANEKIQTSLWQRKT
jgi:hypothetical protein